MERSWVPFPQPFFTSNCLSIFFRGQPTKKECMEKKAVVPGAIPSIAWNRKMTPRLEVKQLHIYLIGLLE